MKSTAIRRNAWLGAAALAASFAAGSALAADKGVDAYPRGGDKMNIERLPGTAADTQQDNRFGAYPRNDDQRADSQPGAAAGASERPSAQQSPPASNTQGYDKWGAYPRNADQLADPQRGVAAGASAAAQPGMTAGAGDPQFGRDDLAEAQDRLDDMGYDVGPADGIWGEQSRAALRRFQEDQGLQKTGELNHKTVEALRIGGGAGKEGSFGGAAGSAGAGSGTN